MASPPFPDTKGRVLLVVIDGLGFNRTRSRAVIDAAWGSLADQDRRELTDLAIVSADAGTHERLARAAIYPVTAEALAENTPLPEARQLLEHVKRIRAQAPSGVIARSREVVREAARTSNYVPWIAKAPSLEAIRNSNLTVPTRASGKWAGYEDTNPPTSGNSETGHQQIMNLTLAPQTPMEISQSIIDRSFFTNRALLEAVRHGTAPGSALNFAFLLSGTRGDNGRVHSAWNHLEAFLELVFGICKADPSRVRMQAILDGRDCPPRSSLEGIGGTGQFLARLESLLSRYRATESIAWVVGRSTAMDRDYREQSTSADYLLLTAGKGEHASGFAGVTEAIARTHKLGKGDSDVPPICVVDSAGQVRRVQSGEAFVNLNFRPDRQRSKTASLLGAREFLSRESELRGRTYSFGWMQPELSLKVCTIAEYHPDFEAQYGAAVAFPVRPQPNNLLVIWPDVMPGATYSLAVESVKALHMGYFFRGRRAEPVTPHIEHRDMTPSYAEADGVRSDSDFMKLPQMRNREVADLVLNRLAVGSDSLICCNLSAPDMIGHILPSHGDESVTAHAAIAAAVTAYEATDIAISSMVKAAVDHGYSVVITSDHGNIEDMGPAHTANDVLTTIVEARGVAYDLAARDAYQGRLFDISWTIARILGAEGRVRNRLGVQGFDFASEFSGSPLIS